MHRLSQVNGVGKYLDLTSSSSTSIEGTESSSMNVEEEDDWFHPTMLRREVLREKDGEMGEKRQPYPLAWDEAPPDIAGISLVLRGRFVGSTSSRLKVATRMKGETRGSALGSFPAK